MSPRDGGLRAIFRDHLKWQWTPIETSTVPGVPDSEFCSPNGGQGWIEFKMTTAWAVVFQPFQSAWLDRRARYGGRAWIAVRRRPIARRYAGNDELWLVGASQAIGLEEFGLRYVFPHALISEGGPAKWNWGDIARTLEGEVPRRAEG